MSEQESEAVRIGAREIEREPDSGSMLGARRSMRFWWILISAISLIALGLGIRFYASSSESLRRMDRVVSDAYETHLAFEQEIGFGGLIHNFKNAVLRPGESGYAEQAKGNAEEALRLSERLQEIFRSLGVSMDWSASDETLRSYLDRIDQVVASRDAGRSAEDVDALVRINDSRLIAERRDRQFELSRALEEVVAAARGSSTRTGLMFMLGPIAALIAALLLASAGRHTAKLETSRAKLETALGRVEHANEALQQFTHIASHDMSKPVRHIEIFCDVIRDDPGSEEHTLANVKRIEETARRLLELVRALTDFSSEGFRSVKAELVPTRELFTDVVRSLEPDIEQAGASVTIGETLDCHADPALLRRVVVNLLSNSIKYRRGDVPLVIEIAAEGEAGSVTYSVTDTGIGVEPRYAERIFEPLKRLHGPQSEYEGFGIGLSLAKAIIDGHGGRIWLDTTYSDGCRIRFRLPQSIRGPASQQARSVPV